MQEFGLYMLSPKSFRGSEFVGGITHLGADHLYSVLLNQPRSQGLSSYRPLERKMRDPGNEVFVERT